MLTIDIEHQELLVCDSNVIAYFVSSVEVGIYKAAQRAVDFGSAFLGSWDGLMELHIFNEGLELRALRDYSVSRKHNYGCRLAILRDPEPDKGIEPWIDQAIMMEKRQWLPMQGQGSVFLKVRNYIRYNEDGMIEVLGYRFIKLQDEKGDSIFIDAPSAQEWSQYAMEEK